MVSATCIPARIVAKCSVCLTEKASGWANAGRPESGRYKYGYDCQNHDPMLLPWNGTCLGYSMRSYWIALSLARAASFICLFPAQDYYATTHNQIKSRRYCSVWDSTVIVRLGGHGGWRGDACCARYSSPNGGPPDILDILIQNDIQYKFGIFSTRG